MALRCTLKGAGQRFVINIEVVTGGREFGNLLRNRFRIVSLCSSGKCLVRHGKCVESSLELDEQIVICLLLIGKFDESADLQAVFIWG